MCLIYRNILSLFKMKIIEYCCKNIGLTTFSESLLYPFVIRCAIWYYLHNFKNVKTPTEECYLVKLQAKSTKSFTKSNTPSWVFFTFFKLYKWYQTAQRNTYIQTFLKMIGFSSNLTCLVQLLKVACHMSNSVSTFIRSWIKLQVCLTVSGHHALKG